MHLLNNGQAVKELRETAPLHVTVVQQIPDRFPIK
jgi:hypothetical protein